jgi:hypothetical protein
MTRQQRFKYEMFVRVRDFGTAHAALFPEASKGGKAFARVLSAVAAIDEHAKNHVLGRAEARRIKEATRESVFEYLKTIAAAARRVTRVESSVNPFVLPTRRSLAAELATARAFMEAAATRRAEFEQFGLPATFISDFRALVDQLRQAADVRLSSKTVCRKAQAGIATALDQGLDAARDLDVIVAIATRQSDPTTFAAWTSARRIEGMASGAAKIPAQPPVPQPVVAAVPSAPSIGALDHAS